jgi:hypothetical protein
VACQKNTISVMIHSSCVNGRDCITVIQNGGKRYHYNTKMIFHYSRQKVMDFLESRNISFGLSEH